MYIIGEIEEVKPDDYIVLMDTPDYKKAWEKPDSDFVNQVHITITNNFFCLDTTHDLCYIENSGNIIFIIS